MKASHLTYFVLGILPFLLPTTVPALQLVLPTENKALFENNEPGFYQFVDRNFNGQFSRPWQGGQYGFVRNPLHVGGKIHYTRFHEGLDIKPMRRDAAGDPLDPIFAVAAGKVVYINKTSSRSNYGLYVVIEHVWDGSPYYSLYAHLHSYTVNFGQTVAQGEIIGRMGYTGVGINQERAHLHFEINLMANTRFEGWHRACFPKDTNWHGLYNGLNLFGINVSRLYLSLQQNPALTIPEFLRTEEPAYWVALAATGRKPELLRLYPWLAGAEAGTQPTTWEIAYNTVGIPLSAKGISKKYESPSLTKAKPSSVPYQYITMGRVQSSAKGPVLSPSGVRFAQLISWGD